MKESFLGSFAITHYSEKVKKEKIKIRVRVLSPLYLTFVREMRKN